MDDLSRIERNYGSVPEYYRSMEDDYNHQAEIDAEWDAYYAKNKKEMDEAIASGKMVIHFADSCVGCPHYHNIPATAGEDDVTHGICNATSNDSCYVEKQGEEGRMSVREYELCSYKVRIKMRAFGKDYKGNFHSVTDVRYFKTRNDAVRFLEENVTIDYSEDGFEPSEDDL